MKITTHTSLHNSGLTNHDFKGKSGTQHLHEQKDGSVKQIWDHPTAGRLTKDKDGIWRKKDGSVFRGE